MLDLLRSWKDHSLVSGEAALTGLVNLGELGLRDE